VKVLVDTSVVVRVAAGAGDPRNEASVEALARLRAKGATLVVVPQVLYELWAVATRPVSNNGLGLTTAEAVFCCDYLAAPHLLRLVEPPSAVAKWRELVALHEVQGNVTHDAHLAATAIELGVAKLLTYNTADFARFTELDAVTPLDVLA
jgi:predicted nucleic acid-binding protein